MDFKNGLDKLFQSRKKGDEEQNEYLAYLRDRVQKITQAVYRVTDLLSDEEPLKWEMRKKSLAIFNLVISPKDDVLKMKIDLEKACSIINQLIPLFAFFEDQYLFSKINFSVLKEEYLAIRNNLNDEIKTPDAQPILAPKSKTAPIGHSIEHLSIGHSKGQKDKGHSKGHSKGHLSKRQSQKSKIVKKKKSKNNKNSIEKEKKERKKKIFDIIKNKQEITMSEICQYFNNWSSKTLQRDLGEMVEEGVLKKEGEKRWTRYFLV